LYKKHAILVVLYEYVYELYMRDKYWKNINKNKTKKYFVD